MTSFTFSFSMYSQNNNFEVQKSIYEKAKSYNDPNVAISALYNMVALQPDNVLLKDSLMREYLAISQWAPSYMISREILGIQPNNNFALEVSCVSLQNLVAHPSSSYSRWHEGLEHILLNAGQVATKMLKNAVHYGL